MKLLRTALRNPSIARLETAAATATLGTWTFSIVLALYAFSLPATSAGPAPR